MKRTRNTYLIGAAVAVLLLGSIGGFLAGSPGESDNTTNAIESSGAEYPPNIDQNGTATPTETNATDSHLDRQNTSDTATPTESATPAPQPEPDVDHRFNATSDVGFAETHTLVFDGEAITPTEFEADADSVENSESSFTYTLRHDGDEPVTLTVTVEFLDANGELVTTVSDTHSLDPGETLTVTRSNDIADYTDE